MLQIATIAAAAAAILTAPVTKSESKVFELNKPKGVISIDTRQYENNMVKIWRIYKSDSDFFVRIRFTECDIEEPHDQIWLLSKLTDLKVRTITFRLHFSVNSSNYRNSEFHLLTPAAVIFKTDGSIAKTGFKLKYNVLYNTWRTMPAEQIKINQTPNTRDSHAFFNEGTYPGSLRLSWILLPPPRQLVKVKMLEFRTDNAKDFLMIHQGLPGRLDKRRDLWHSNAEGKSFQPQLFDGPVTLMFSTEKGTAKSRGFRFRFQSVPQICEMDFKFSPVTNWVTNSDVTVTVDVRDKELPSEFTCSVASHNVTLQLPLESRSKTQSNFTLKTTVLTVSSNWSVKCVYSKPKVCKGILWGQMLGTVHTQPLCHTRVTFTPSLTWLTGQQVTADVITNSKIQLPVNHVCFLQNDSQIILLPAVTSRDGHTSHEFTADAKMNSGKWKLICNISQTGFCDKQEIVTLKPVLVKSSLYLPPLPPVTENSLVKVNISVTPGVPSPTVTCHVNDFQLAVTHKNGDRWMVQVPAMMRWNGSKVNCTVTQVTNTETEQWQCMDSNSNSSDENSTSSDENSTSSDENSTSSFTVLYILPTNKFTSSQRVSRISQFSLPTSLLVAAAVGVISAAAAALAIHLFHRLSGERAESDEAGLHQMQQMPNETYISTNSLTQLVQNK